MPELPEVETIRRQLAKKVIGRCITKIDVLVKKMFTGDAKKILNQKIVDVSRRGKQMQIKFENGYSLLVHFKLNGQLIRKSNIKNQRSKIQIKI